MKLPKTPPPWRDLAITELSRENAVSALVAGAELLARGRYFHWDELLRRTPPAPLTHAQWWFGAKLARMGSRQDVPLRDIHGAAFNFVHTNLVQERLHEIDLSLGGSIALPEADRGLLHKKKSGKKLIFAAAPLLQQRLKEPPPT